MAMRKALAPVFRHALALALAMVLALAPAAIPTARALPSEWADYELELARQWGLINPYLLYYVPCVDMISKDIFCEMAVTLCEKLTGSPINADNSVEFYDDDWYIPEHFYKAYSAKIVNGKGITPDGKIELGKADKLNREEVFKMLYNAIVYCKPGEAVGSGEIEGILSAFSDSADISGWARGSAAYVAQNGIVKGSDGMYLPMDYCTVEQGIITIKRVYEVFASDNDRMSAPLLAHCLDAPAITVPGEGETLDIKDGVTLRWNPVSGASGYRLRFMTELGVTDTFINEPFYTLEAWALNLGVNSFALTAVDESWQPVSRAAFLMLNMVGSPNTGPHSKPKNEELNYFDFKSAEEAEAYMTTVTVKVWKLNSSGEKYTGTIEIKVHKYIADDVVSIFSEIYNGPEKFPIHSAGGFDWRNGWGEHPKGTAIDINANENYQIFSDGRIVGGTLWAPGENPYSIPIGGDVERAFRNYGWGWGGADWRNNNDYMHFSYFGT